MKEQTQQVQELIQQAQELIQHHQLTELQKQHHQLTPDLDNKVVSFKSKKSKQDKNRKKEQQKV